MRIFRDDDGRTSGSILDTGDAALVVSQFTLYADTSRGRRPGFTDAADAAFARLWDGENLTWADIAATSEAAAAAR